jgi:Zn-dependent protease with chaperone function
VRVILHLVSAAVGVSLLGCAAQPPRAAWTHRHGGLLHGERHERLLRVAERVTADLSLSCRFHILNTSQLCAYAWPDRAVYVSRGLIDALDDEELAAAIAHELGHLLDGGHVAPPAGLRGDRFSGDDPEMRADAIAAVLLNRVGVPPDAVARMLEKVAASEDVLAETRAKMTTRAGLIRKAAPNVTTPRSSS